MSYLIHYIAVTLETFRRPFSEGVSRSTESRSPEVTSVPVELNKQLRLEEQSEKDQKKQATIARKRKLEDPPPIEPKLPETRVARSGRTVVIPSKFKE